jgi:hypothetical protein
MHKNVVLKCMGEHLRSWKSRLVNKYIIKTNPLKHANPYDTYNISPA